MSGVGNSMRLLREQAGVTVPQVARAGLIGASFLEAIEGGRLNPTASVNSRLTRYYASLIAISSQGEAERRAELLDLVIRAEERVRDYREVVGSAQLASGRPAPGSFEEKVTGSGGGLLATHYAQMVLQTTRAVLTGHTAGSIEPHIFGFAESIARDVLQEPRQENHA